MASLSRPGSCSMEAHKPCPLLLKGRWRMMGASWGPGKGRIGIAPSPCLWLGLTDSMHVHDAQKMRLHAHCAPRCMALSLAPHGIRVNAIGPGSIMTEVLSSVVGDQAALSRCCLVGPLLRGNLAHQGECIRLEPLPCRVACALSFIVILPVGNAPCDACCKGVAAQGTAACGKLCSTACMPRGPAGC